MTRLVYAEEFDQVEEAIAREKQLKGWKRIRKNELVRAANPKWDDLMPIYIAMTSFALLRTTGGAKRHRRPTRLNF